MWRMHLAGDIPVVVIVGPTAVGKTSFAIDLAERIDGEIVGADSRQTYRLMDIGTAKPTPAERQRMPHHLIDVVYPDEQLSLAQYQKLAYEAIESIAHRGKIPLLVGGTGQYISAVIEGWSIPEVPPNYALRNELETYARIHGSEALHKRLQKTDPISAEKIEHQNIRRVVRALEVCIETNQRMSDLQRKKPPPYSIYGIGLDMERENLYQRADHRVDLMMENGLLEEVRMLLDKGYSRKLPSMSGIGYRQLIEHLLDNVPLDTAVETTKTVTHDFIRRQYTWFRKYNHSFMWHNVEEFSPQHVIADVEKWLSQKTFR